MATVRRRHSQRSRSSRISYSSTFYSDSATIDLEYPPSRRQPQYELQEHQYGNSSVVASVSTPTLVNPPPSLHLVFDRNSVINATLHARSGPMYKIKTNKHVTRTDICDLTEERVVATWKRREIFPNVVVFPHRIKKSIKISKWLKKRKHPGASPTVELRTQSDRFIWKSDEAHRFALYSESDDQATVPIAYSRMLQEPPTLALVIRDGPSRITQLEIITSFLVLEHKLRMKEKRLGMNQMHRPVGAQFLMMGS